MRMEGQVIKPMAARCCCLSSVNALKELLQFKTIAYFMVDVAHRSGARQGRALVPEAGGCGVPSRSRFFTAFSAPVMYKTQNFCHLEVIQAQQCGSVAATPGCTAAAVRGRPKPGKQSRFMSI